MSMKLRRANDRDLTLVLAGPAGWEVADRGGTAGSGPPPEQNGVRRGSLPAPPLLFVAEVSGDHVDGLADEKDNNGALPVSRVVPGHVAASLRAEALRARKRRELPDKLLEYFADLNRSDGEAEVYSALARNVVQIVEAYRAVIFLPDANDPDALTCIAGSENGEPYSGVARLERFARPGTISASEIVEGSEPALETLVPLLAGGAVCTLAHVPVGHGGVLILLERRDDRIFESEDWEMLCAVILLGEMALERVRLLESVQSLALTDPLTGLANRRHMEVVMGHAWAAAQRGESLAVMVLDLDDFKKINDSDGHLAGDALLFEVAEALKQESRGSDTVVRYGGDEFLVILSPGDMAGARALVRRLRARLGNRIGLSEGIAVCGPAHTCAEELIRDADRSLYSSKRTKGHTSPR
jgi:diguanylate cyclase (GGDEF)-like protein